MKWIPGRAAEHGDPDEALRAGAIDVILEAFRGIDIEQVLVLQQCSFTMAPAGLVLIDPVVDGPFDR